METNTLQRPRVATRPPAEDLERARRFYLDMLGLEPTEERQGVSFTQLAFDVDDIEATVAELRERGVILEEVDIADLETLDRIPS